MLGAGRRPDGAAARLEAGILPERETHDADAVVDVRVAPDVTARLSRYLARAGLVLAGIGTDHQGHRFVGAELSVDVLAPDNLGARATLTTIPPARTVEVPAGTRLLRAPRRVPVACGSAVALVPRPSLDAAIVGKAAALTLPDAHRHRTDLAFLLGLVHDVRAVRASLTRSDRRWLQYAAPLLDDQLVWRAAPDAAAARAALRFLLRDQ